MRLTFSGWAFLAIGAALTAAAYLAALPGLLPVGVLVFGLTPLSAASALFGARALRITVRIDAPAAGDRLVAEVGRQLRLLIDVHNRHVLPTQGERLQLDLSPAFGADVSTRLPRIRPRQSQAIVHTVTPELRGVHRLGDGSLTVFGPFSLCRIRRRLEGGNEIAVSAAISPMRLPAQTTATRAMEESSRLSVGSATRDFHAREYVPGDDLRFVHWATTARLGALMVRNESEEHILSAVLLVDLRADRYASEEAFETMAIGLTSAAAAFLRKGYEVTVLQPETPPLHLHGRRSILRLRRVSAELEARADPALPHWPTQLGRPTQIVACCGHRSQELLDRIPRQSRVRTVVLAANEVMGPDDGLHRRIFRMPTVLPSQWRSLRHEASA